MPPLSLLKNPPPFDILADFAPVSQVTRLEWAIYISPLVPAKSTTEFIEFARKNSEKLSFASSNLSEHLAAAQFMTATGTKLVRVPCKGFAQAMPDIMAGRVHMNVAPAGIVGRYRFGYWPRQVDKTIKLHVFQSRTG